MSESLGPCCICERAGKSVRNILQLHQKSPTPGRGWGCVVCNLPTDGAVAVVCDKCLSLMQAKPARAELKFACKGNLIEQEFQYPQVSFEDPDDITVPMGDCLEIGRRALKAKKAADAGIVGKFSHDVTWNGLKFLCLNSASFNSQTFESAVRPDHDALMGWRYDGKSGKCAVSLYHAPGKTDIDLSKFAVAMKGGGHRGAAGFQVTLAELATIIGAQ